MYSYSIDGIFDRSKKKRYIRVHHLFEASDEGVCINLSFYFSLISIKFLKIPFLILSGFSIVVKPTYYHTLIQNCSFSFIGCASNRYKERFQVLLTIPLLNLAVILCNSHYFEYLVHSLRPQRILNKNITMACSIKCMGFEKFRT